MNEEKTGSGSSKDATKKMCPRAARENSKKKSEDKPWNRAHTGLKFHFDRKKLVTHEFSFNSVSKTEKVTISRSREKPTEIQMNGDAKTGTKEIKFLMDTLKVSKSEECSVREKSPLRKEMPMSPVVERLTTKRDCSRCSRCSKSPKEEKADIKHTKVSKIQNCSPKPTKKENNAAKTVKLEAPQSPKICKKQCPKLAKLQAETGEKTIKPKSILIHADHSRDKGKTVSNNSELKTPPLSPKTVKIEVPKSPKTCKKQCSKLAKLLAEPQEKISNLKANLVQTEKPVSRDSGKNDASKNCEKSATEELTSEKSNSVIEKKPDFAWPSSGTPGNETSELSIPDVLTTGSSNVLNGSEPSFTSETVACLLNGGRHDEHICDPHHGLETPDEIRKELETMKAPSKIPRKTHGAAGLKADAILNKDMMAQQLIEF